MAKPQACPRCGTWYNPKFAGNEDMCSTCLVKEIIKTREEDIVKEKVKEVHKPLPSRKTEPIGTRKKEMSLQHEYEALCNKCGETIQGIERFDRELGWVIQWKHSQHPAWYCLAV